MNFISFPSIERLENIYCVITEKIDGTNGLIEISKNNNEYDIKYGSRNRYLDIHNDNYGFMNFFYKQEEKLMQFINNFVFEQEEDTQLPIRIYGEWCGLGIQRNYGVIEKYFMPFSNYYAKKLIENGVSNILVPNILYQGKFSYEIIETCMDNLPYNNLFAFPDPEGIVIHFPKYNFRLKHTYEKK